jgi:hypothetical protein
MSNHQRLAKAAFLAGVFKLFFAGDSALATEHFPYHQPKGVVVERTHIPQASQSFNNNLTALQPTFPNTQFSKNLDPTTSFFDSLKQHFFNSCEQASQKVLLWFLEKLEESSIPYPDNKDWRIVTVVKVNKEKNTIIVFYNGQNRELGLTEFVRIANRAILGIKSPNISSSESSFIPGKRRMPSFPKETPIVDIHSISEAPMQDNSPVAAPQASLPSAPVVTRSSGPQPTHRRIQEETGYKPFVPRARSNLSKIREGR